MTKIILSKLLSSYAPLLFTAYGQMPYLANKFITLSAIFLACQQGKKFFLKIFIALLFFFFCKMNFAALLRITAVDE